ncbi:LysM peptidoglycan-binding domain-containing protein, partial [Arthrospira platensis SPKY1]|nr:LysM peptidoglycan-binding domain-containing protein [Arthrospira platensis SPKY1]
VASPKSENVQDVTEENINIETPKKKIQHVIQKGETLNSIAKKYQVTSEEIKLWNELNSHQIVAGNNLVILTNDADVLGESQRKQQAVKTQDSQPKYYMVKKGDSLYSISLKFEGVTVADLKRWNEIRGSQIKPGMKLKVSGS